MDVDAGRGGLSDHAGERDYEAELPNVLSCGELDNVAIKLSGADTLSDSDREILMGGSLANIHNPNEFSRARACPIGAIPTPWGIS